MTWLGIIMVAINARNRMFLPLNSNLVNAYAVSDAITIIVIGIAIDRKIEFKINLPKGKTSNNRR